MRRAGSSLAVPYINDMSCLQVNDYRLVHMPLADGKLVDADEPDIADVRAGIVMLQVVLVDVLHR